MPPTLCEIAFRMSIPSLSLLSIRVSHCVVAPLISVQRWTVLHNYCFVFKNSLYWYQSHVTWLGFCPCLVGDNYELLEQWTVTEKPHAWFFSYIKPFCQITINSSRGQLVTQWTRHEKASWRTDCVTSWVAPHALLQLKLLNGVYVLWCTGWGRNVCVLQQQLQRCTLLYPSVHLLK